MIISEPRPDPPSWRSMVAAVWNRHHPKHKELIGITLAELEFLGCQDMTSRWTIKHINDPEVRPFFEAHLKKCLAIGRLPLEAAYDPDPDAAYENVQVEGVPF